MSDHKHPIIDSIAWFARVITDIIMFILKAIWTILKLLFRGIRCICLSIGRGIKRLFKKKPKNDQVFGFSMYSINLNGRWFESKVQNPIGLNQLQMGLLIPGDSQLSFF